MSAGAIRAPLKQQFAFVVPFRQQVGKAAPIAPFVDRDACIVAAGRAAGAPDRASLATPPGSEKVACGAVQRALSLIQCSSLSYDYPTGGKVRAHPFRPPSGPVIHPACGSAWPYNVAQLYVMLAESIRNGKKEPLLLMARCGATG